MSSKPRLQFTTLDLEIAQCLWEGVLDSLRGVPPPGRARTTQDIRDTVDRQGFCYTRAVMRQPAIIEIVRLGWDMLTEEQREVFVPFDWEFVPFVVHNCLDWDDRSGVTIKPDWRTIIMRAATSLL